jgi:hypothetical protein
LSRAAGSGLDSGSGVRQDGPVNTLREGHKIWVEQADGSQREAIYVGEAEQTWFGGGAAAYVVYPDTRSGEEVAIMRIVPRDDPE